MAHFQFAVATLLFGLLQLRPETYLASALVVAGRPAVVEFAPVIIAAREYYDGKVDILDGGVANFTQAYDIDLAGNAETQALKYYQDFPSLRAIYTVAEVYYRFAASKKSGIVNPKDLKGKRIGAMANTSASYFATTYLTSLGLESGKDYTLVDGFFCNKLPCADNALPSMLQRGEVDAVAMWEPTLQLSIDLLGKDNVVVFEQEAYREIYNLYTSAAKLANPKTRAEIVKFLLAVREVSEELEAAPPKEAIARVAAVVDGADLDIITKTWSMHHMRGTLAADLLDVLEKEEVWSASMAGRKVSTRAELSKMIDTSVLEEVLALEAVEGCSA